MARSNESPPIRVAITEVSPWMRHQSKAIQVGDEYDVTGAIHGPHGRVSDVFIQPPDCPKPMLVFRLRYLAVEPWAGEYTI